MNNQPSSLARLNHTIKRFPRVAITHAPTPIEELSNLGADLGLSLFVKRDDCTGFGLGGNKVRQLEFYMGAAQAEAADTLLITGAVQSNFVRTAAAVAARFNMQCHVQLEKRVDNSSELYRENGNVLLDKLLGAHLHRFPEGENEAAADNAMAALADKLKADGARPYIVHLGADQTPDGAIGYMVAAMELAQQMKETKPFDEIVVASGSALTHIGLLFGLRALDIQIPVRGICVRRSRELQTARVRKRLYDLAALTGLDVKIKESDILLHDDALAPGYGMIGQTTLDAIHQAARREGLFLDPVYTGKTMAGLKLLAERGEFLGRRVLFWHTGGQPALFSYADQLV